MTPWQNRVTDLTRRMADDMKLRNYSQRTIDAYTCHLGRFAEFLGKSPMEATAEDIRSFQLHMIEVRKIQWSSFNQAVCGLRFFFRTTTPRPWPVTMIPFGKRPKKLPAVLSGEEVNRLLSCVKCHKHRVFLLTQYAAGLRLNEAAHLKISDIDSQRMQLRVESGKGQKTRLVPNCDGRYLCDADELKSQFRATFLAGLRRLHASGKLQLHGDWEFLRDSAAFEEWLAPLDSITWVAYIEAPPNEHCEPEQVAKYLARYLTGGPISDRRLVSDEDGFVTFLARAGDKTGGSDETIPIRISGAEFVRRWSLHILPKGYTKTRRFGGYSNYHRERYLAECRELLGAVPSSPVDAVGEVTAPSDCKSEAVDDRSPCCPKCDARMRRIDLQPKPSWRTVMHSVHRPHWYRDD